MAKYVEPFPASTRNDVFGDLSPYREGRPHRGQDWTVPEGSLIRAMGSGAIKVNEWSDGLGWFVIQSTDGGKKFILYAHLKEQPKLKVGKFVYAGKTPIGRVGTTGRFSTGSHLHLSVGTKQNVHTCAYGDLLDPLELLKESE